MSYLARLRWTRGYSCPKCGCAEVSYIRGRGLYQCRKCRYQASVTSGTIFHKTRAPLPKWFFMIFLMGKHSGHISILRMSKLLDLQYSTAWTTATKLKKALEGKEELLQAKPFDQGAFDQVVIECLQTGAHTFSDLIKRGNRRADKSTQPEN